MLGFYEELNNNLFFSFKYLSPLAQVIKERSETKMHMSNEQEIGKAKKEKKSEGVQREVA